MRKMSKIKRLVICALATTVLATGFNFGSSTAYASTEERAIKDGKVLNGRIYGPIRAIGEELDAEVNWNNKTREATVIKGDDVITLKLGSKILKVNNREIQMDVSVYLENGRTYLPLRYLGEALGKDMAWYQNKQMAYLYADVPAIAIYAQPIFYKDGYELLDKAISKTTNLSAIPQKRAHLRPYFTDEMINKIIQNNGLNLEILPSNEDQGIIDYYYPNGKTMKVTKFVFSYDNRGVGYIYQESTLVKKNGKWLVDSIEEEWNPYRP